MDSMVVRSKRVVLTNRVRPAAIYVNDGRIAAIGDYGDTPARLRTIDAGDLVVLPGLVDTHVHINDPGRADWEGFDTATRAAAAGGVTTLIDMPLNSVPATTSVEGFDAKVRAARGMCHVDVGFWGGVVPWNAEALEPLAQRGVLGYKCFLSPSGVEEFVNVSEDDLRDALPVIARLGLPLLVHAELPALLRNPDPFRDPREYGTWLESRPPEAEHAAIELLIRLAREYRVHIHVVHLASADALPMLDEARAAGVSITTETCPHYLTFAAEDIPDGATAFKCAPPIRSRDHRDRLWRALAADQIDLVATDHSPAPPALKRLDDGDFVRAWGGIASLQLGLAIMWTGAAQHGMLFDYVARWMSAAPARLAGILQAKGAIAVGRDADLVIWDPDAEFTVDPASLYHRHPITPYAGRRLRGLVRTTMLRGEIVFDQGRFLDVPAGELLLREDD
jgi:allantoinase